MNSFLDWLAVALLRRRGYSPYMAPAVWRTLVADFFGNRHATLRQKLWAYRRGFLSERIARYSLSDANVHLFLPDLPYLKWHPINRQFSQCIDDKLTMRYVLSAYAQYLPRYYFLLRRGLITRLMDCQGNVSDAPSVDDVVGLLERDGHLAVKPWAGSGGEGFYKLSAVGGLLCINDREVARQEVRRLLGNLRRYIVTEYLKSHPEIRLIYPTTVNTLRLMVVSDPDDGPQIVGAFMRFGVSGSGMVDNAGAGGIFCGVDLATGELFSPRRVVSGRMIEIGNHPDTGQPIARVRLPHWQSAREKVTEISRHVPQLVYLGYDIVITADSFKIIEINSHQDVQYIQPFGALYLNDYARRFFQARLRAR